jgi:hypothetical protein
MSTLAKNKYTHNKLAHKTLHNYAGRKYSLLLGRSQETWETKINKKKQKEPGKKGQEGLLA